METPALFAISQRRREESSTVPEEKAHGWRQAGNLLGHDGQHVAGVGDEHDDGVGATGKHVRQQLLEDGNVCAGQFEAGWPGFWRHLR